MANMLLESFTFLYDDLDASNPKKAFPFHFVLQLLNVAHLQYMNWVMQKGMLVVPPLHTYCGVFSLCGAAVCTIDKRNRLTLMIYMYVA